MSLYSIDEISESKIRIVNKTDSYELDWNDVNKVDYNNIGNRDEIAICIDKISYNINLTLKKLSVIYIIFTEAYNRNILKGYGFGFFHNNEIFNRKSLISNIYNLLINFILPIIFILFFYNVETTGNSIYKIPMLLIISVLPVLYLIEKIINSLSYKIKTLSSSSIRLNKGKTKKIISKKDISSIKINRSMNFVIVFSDNKKTYISLHNLKYELLIKSILYNMKFESV